MSSAESSTFNRHGLGRSFGSGAARQSQAMVHAPEYSSLADRVRNKIAGNRSYDKRYETKYNKNGSESYSIGSFLRKSFMPTLGERTSHPKLDKLKTRFISGQESIGNYSENIRLQMNNTKSWLDNSSSDTQAYERKSFQAKLEQARSDIDTNKRTITSLRDQLDKSETDLIQSQTKERQLENQLENAKRDLKKARNESNQGRDLADLEREQRLHMEQEFEGLLHSQKQHIYNLQGELEKEKSAAKTKESDEEIILDLERKIKHFQTELGIEKRLKDEAKQDHEDIQAELDELLSENEGLRNKLRQSKQDNERLQDEHQDLIDEYKGIMENNFGEELEARILEGEAIAGKKFDQERAELVQEIEQYRQYGEQLQEENNEFKMRMQRKLEELKQVRSELSKSKSYRQQDIDRLLQEKESLKTELKKKKRNLTSLEGNNQELLEAISQMEREMKKLQRRKLNAEESLVAKTERFELEKKLEGKEFEIANLDAKIEDLQASLRCQNDPGQDISGLNIKLKEDLHKMEESISEKEFQIVNLKKLNSDITDKLQMQESNFSQELQAIHDHLSQKMLRLEEISEANCRGLTEKIDELMEQKAALQDSCKHLKVIAGQKKDAALVREAIEARNQQFQDENAELAAKLQEITEHLDDINEQNAALKDSYTDLQVIVQNKEEAVLELQAREARNSQCQYENAELAAKLQELTAKLDEINEQNAVLQASCKNFEVMAGKNEDAALEHQACGVKIKHFENENAELAANLQELTAKLDEINKEKAALQDSCKHFEDMAEQNEEAALDHKACGDKIKQFENENAELAANLQELTAKLDEINKEKAALQDSCKHFEDMAEQNEEAALDHKACGDKIKQFENENAELAANLQELTAKLDEIKQQNAALHDRSSRFDILTAQNEEAALEIQASGAKLNELEGKNAELKSKLLANNNVMEELKQSRSDVDILKRQASELEADLQAKDSAIAEIQGQEYTFTELKEENEILQNEISDLRTSLQKVESTVAAKDDALNVQHQDLKDLVDRMSAQENELTAINTRLENEIKELKDSLKEAENDMETQQEKFEKEVQELEQKIVFMKAEENQLRRCVAELELQLNEERKQTKDIPKQDLQNEGKQLATLEAKINDLKSDKQELQNEIKELKESLKEAENDMETQQEKFEKEVQELEQKIVFMKAEENQLRRCIAELELQLNEERKQTKDFPKQDLQNEGEQLATLEAKTNDLESDKQEWENMIQSSKKQLQDQEKKFEAAQNSLINKLQEAEKKCHESIKEQLSLKTKLNESKAAQKDLDQRVADCETLIAEKEAEIQENAKKIAESEELLDKSEEERLQCEDDLAYSRRIFDKWSTEFMEVTAENDDLKEKLGKLENVSESQKTTADNSDKLNEDIQELQESLTTMKEREGRIQNHNYEMKKKVDAGDKLQKELEHQIKELNDELSKVKQDLEDTQIETKAQQDERNVLKMQNDNWEELKNIAEQRQSEVKAKDKLIDEIDAENRQFRADIRKLEFTIRELEDKMEGLESDKEECQEMKEFYQEQFEKRKDSQELLERTENDLKNAYEDIQVLSKQKKELTIKCHQLEDKIMKSGCGQQKDESATPKANQTAEEKDQDDQNGGYESDFEEDDEKSASENYGKEDDQSDREEDDQSDRESIASDVSEIDDLDNNNNKVDDNNSNSNGNNASANNSQNHIESDRIDNKHNDDDEDGSVNFSDDSDCVLSIIPSETGIPSASVKDQGSGQNIKSILTKTGRKKSSPNEEAKRKVTFNNDEEVRYIFNDDSFEEPSDDEDFYNEGYVPSFSGRSTRPQLDDSFEEEIAEEIIVEEIEEEDDIDVTSLANQRSASSGASNHDIFEEENDMLSSFITTQKKKQKDSAQASKKRKMEIELGLADSIDDLLDEIEASEGSEDEAAGAKAAKKEATSKGSGDAAAKTDASDKAAENNDSNEIQIPQNSDENCGQDVNEESEENVTEDITVEEINIDEADYFEHIEPLELDAENEPNFAVPTAESASGLHEAENENVTEDITVEEINLDEADYFEHIEPLELDAENEPNFAVPTADFASGLHEAENENATEAGPTEAAERASDVRKETHSDNEENSDSDSSITGIERRPSDMLFSPSFPPPQRRGLPPLAGRAGALPPLKAGAGVPPLGARAGVLRPLRRKNKNL